MISVVISVKSAFKLAIQSAVLPEPRDFKRSNSFDNSALQVELMPVLVEPVVIAVVVAVPAAAGKPEVSSAAAVVALTGAVVPLGSALITVAAVVADEAGVTSVL